jgi:hypothetical protein
VTDEVIFEAGEVEADRSKASKRQLSLNHRKPCWVSHNLPRMITTWRGRSFSFPEGWYGG